MRKETKEIIHKEYKDIFIAVDGTEFDTEEECKKYEKTAEEEALNAAFERTMFGSVIGYVGEEWDEFGYEMNLFCVQIKDENDLHEVNKWAKRNELTWHNSYTLAQFGSGAIGTIQVLGEHFGIGEKYAFGTVEELNEHLHNKVDKLISELITPQNNMEEK